MPYDYYSDELQVTVDEPGTFADVSELGGRVRVLKWTFTNDTGSTIPADAVVNIGKLPAGRCRLLRMGEMASSALGASRTGKVGYAKFTDWDGNEVAADDDAIKSSVSLAAAADGIEYNAAAAASWFFNSRAGVELTLTLAGGTIPDGAVVQGLFLYVKD